MGRGYLSRTVWAASGLSRGIRWRRAAGSRLARDLGSRGISAREAPLLQAKRQNVLRKWCLAGVGRGGRSLHDPGMRAGAGCAGWGPGSGQSGIRRRKRRLARATTPSNRLKKRRTVRFPPPNSPTRAGHTAGPARRRGSAAGGARGGTARATAPALSRRTPRSAGTRRPGCGRRTRYRCVAPAASTYD